MTYHDAPCTAFMACTSVFTANSQIMTVLSRYFTFRSFASFT